MAVLTALAATAAIGSMAYGVYQGQQAKEKAEQGYALQAQGSAVQAQAARELYQIETEKASSSVEFAGRQREMNIEASDFSKGVSNQSLDINRQVNRLERANEQVRRQAMELDARRKSSEILRQQQRARAMALTTATRQGASGGSALQGAYAGFAGQAGVNYLGVQQNLSLGRQTFNNNEAISNQKLAGYDLENQYALFRAGMQTRQADLAFQYAQINAGYQTRTAGAQTLSSQGQGIINQGQGHIGMAQMQNQQASQFISMGPQLFSMGMNLNSMAPSFGNFFGANTAISSGPLSLSPTSYGGNYYGSTPGINSGLY